VRRRSGAARRGQERPIRPDMRGHVGRAWNSAGAGWSGAARHREEGERGIERADERGSTRQWLGEGDEGDVRRRRC
jgi:hypothetical protein